jgi:hypothetical protein
MRILISAAFLVPGLVGTSKAEEEFECGTDCGAACFRDSTSPTATVGQLNCQNSCIADQVNRRCFNEAQQTHPHGHPHFGSHDEEPRREELRRERERARIK